VVSIARVSIGSSALSNLIGTSTTCAAFSWSAITSSNSSPVVPTSR
jgi:hypothetical protein